ncbi:sialidase family protein [Paenibacillus arenilitoris]|uniref:Exo-alpha-sialidase n=1 Tax=Paenibacillus arenilitoris TaxID=2772299 RepID=A0A927CQG0_9BACL|nr:sialidase family protein [Paenibacillus arenilitoris]MBD2871854.1 exo-alpha-sialidase [Paenibacillus arenilitoris]
MIEKYAVSRDDDWYEAWPDLALTRSGKLICVFAQCTHHGDRSATRLMMIESADRGRSWGNKRPLTAVTNGRPYWNCARITRLRDGRLVIVADQITKEKEGGGRNYLWIGDAEGERWSEPIETPLEGIVPDKLCELPSGRWLLSAHMNGQWLRYSDNQGQDWSEPVLVARQEGLKLCEGSILPLDDGTLVAFLRENSGDGQDCYKAISYDQGETWNGVYRMPLPGCHRPVAGLLRSGSVMIAYRFMQGGKGWLGYWTQNFFVALTDQASAKATERKEQWTRIMPVDYDRSPVADLGYSGWVQFDDGEIYIVQYIVDDAPKGQIRGYSLREEEFLLPPAGAR